MSSQLEEPLLAEQGQQSGAAPQQGESSSPTDGSCGGWRRLRWLLPGVTLVVGLAIAVAVNSQLARPDAPAKPPTDSPEQLARDDALTGRLRESIALNLQASGGRVELDHRFLGAAGAEQLHSWVGASSLPLVEASLLPDVSGDDVFGGRRRVRVRGSATILGRARDCTVTLMHHMGDVMFAAAASAEAAASTAVGEAEPWNAALSEEETRAVMQAIDGARLGNVRGYTLASGPQPHPVAPELGWIDAGLSIEAPLASDEGASTTIFAKLGLTQGVHVRGVVRPNVALMAQQFPPTGEGSSVQIDAFLRLENVTVRYHDKVASVSAVLVVSPPGLDSLSLQLVGNASAAAVKGQTLLSLSGDQIGAWSIPGGNTTGVSISRAHGDVQVTIDDASRATSCHGSVAARVGFRQAGGFFHLALPIANVTQGLALEVDLSDVGAVCGSDIVTTRAALVFSPYAGSYAFSDAQDAPVAQMNVVNGVNFAAEVDIARSASLRGLATLYRDLVAAGTGGTTTVSLTGGVSYAGHFAISGVAADVPLSPDVTLTRVMVTVSDQSPLVAVTAQLSVSGHVLGSTTPVVFNVALTVTDSSVALSGDATAGWEFTVGSFQVVVDRAIASFSYDWSTKTFSGRVSADANQGEIQLVLEYPNDAAQPCVTLSFVERVPITLLRTLDRFLPAETRDATVGDTLARVEERLARELFNTSLDSVSLLVSPQCGNISLSATISSNLFHGTLGILLEVARVGGSWGFHVVVWPPHDWQFVSSDLFGSDALPRGLRFAMPILVVSSRGVSLTVPVDFGARGNWTNEVVSFDVVQGLTLRIELPLGGDASGNNSAIVGAPVLGLMPSRAAELVLVGQLPRDGLWSLTALLVPVGNYVSLGRSFYLQNASLIIARQRGVALSAQVETPLPNYAGSGAAPLLLFDVEANLSLGAQDVLDLYGPAHSADAAVPVPIGHSGLALEELALRLRVAWEAASGQHVAVSGSLEAKVEMGGGAHLAVEVDLLADESVGFSGDLQATPPLTLGALLRKLLGDEAVRRLLIPGSVALKLDSDFSLTSLAVRFTSRPLSLSATGTMNAFSREHLAITLSLSRAPPAPGGSGGSGSDWALVFGVDVSISGDAHAAVSSVLPSVSALDDLPMGSLAVVIATRASSVSFPGLAAPLSAVAGFNLFAVLQLAGSGVRALESVANWTGAAQASVSAAIQNEARFSLHADLQGDLPLLGHRVDLTAAGLLLQVAAAEVQFGVESDALVRVSSRPSDQLHFHGDLYFSELGLGFDAAMENDWVNPLGARGLVLKRADLSLGLTWALVPDRVGIAGGVYFGDVGGQGAVYMSDDAAVVYGELDDLSLQRIVDSVLADVGVSKPPRLVQTLTDVSLKQLVVYVNPAAQPVTFFNDTFPPGFRVSVQRLDLWEVLVGSASVVVSDSGLVLNASLAPIRLLDGLIELHGARSRDDAPSLYLALGKGQDAPRGLAVDAGLELLGQYLAADVSIDDHDFSISVNLQLLNDLLDFSLECHAEGAPSHPSDFSFNASATNRLQDYIAEHVPPKAREHRSDADAALQRAIDDVKKKHDDLDGLETEIARLRAEDSRALSDAQKAVYDAEADLEHAKAHVNELQNKIDALKEEVRGLKWYEMWKLPGLEVAIGALYTAKATADGALDVAKGALEAAQKALQAASGVAPDVDPRVLALLTARGAAVAALDAAEAVLRGAQSVVDAVEIIVEKMAVWQSQVFNVEHISLSGSLGAVAHGDLATLQLQGVFLDHRVNVTAHVDLKVVETMVEGVWAGVQDAFSQSDSRRSVDLALRAEGVLPRWRP